MGEPRKELVPLSVLRCKVPRRFAAPHHWETDPSCKDVNRRRIVDTMDFYANVGFFRRLRNVIVKWWKKAVQRRPRVFFDVTTAGQQAGRIIVKLYNVDVPKSAENFRALCTGERGSALHYKGCRFYSVIPGIMCQVCTTDLCRLHRVDYNSNRFAGGQAHSRRRVWRRYRVSARELCSRTQGEQSERIAVRHFVCAFEMVGRKVVVIGRVLKGIDVLKLIDSQGTLSAKTKNEADGGKFDGSVPKYPKYKEKPLVSTSS